MVLLLCSCCADFHYVTVMQLLCLWGLCTLTTCLFLLLDKENKTFLPLFIVSADWGRLHSVPECPWGRIIICCNTNRPYVCGMSLAASLSWNYPSVYGGLFSLLLRCCVLWQVLGRKSPFPLILLPQFGGYWIEGTNHELGDTVEGGQLEPLSPNTRTKLECNTTANLYRKHFLGKVSYYLHYLCYLCLILVCRCCKKYKVWIVWKFDEKWNKITFIYNEHSALYYLLVADISAHYK